MFILISCPPLEVRILLALAEQIGGLIRTPGQRGCRDIFKTLLPGYAIVSLKGFWADIFFYGFMICRWRQILPHGQNIAAGPAQIAHHGPDLILMFTQPDHDAGFGHHRRM